MSKLLRHRLNVLWSLGCDHEPDLHLRQSGHSSAPDFPITSPTEMTGLLEQVGPLLLRCVLVWVGFTWNDWAWPQEHWANQKRADTAGSGSLQREWLEPGWELDHRPIRNQS